MAGLKSQRVGKNWEKEIIDTYYSCGWQPFKIPTELVGTCFDIIMIKNSAVMCVEAKHITGEKLYYKGSGLSKKVDELNHFVRHCNTNVYLFVKSDKTGTWWTSWIAAKKCFDSKGYICKDDCISMDMNAIRTQGGNDGRRIKVQ